MVLGALVGSPVFCVSIPGTLRDGGGLQPYAYGPGKPPHPNPLPKAVYHCFAASPRSRRQASVKINAIAAAASATVATPFPTNQGCWARRKCIPLVTAERLIPARR